MCCMWPRFIVLQRSQSCRLRLARAINVFHTCRHVIVYSQFTWCSSPDARQVSVHMTATEFLSASCANLRSQMLSERGWRETSFVSASQDRRQSFQSVSLATNTVAGLSDRHSEFVCRSLPGGRINRTDARRWSSVNRRRYVFRTLQWCPCSCQPVTGQFQSLSTWSRRVNVVHVRVNCSLASSSRRWRGRDVPLSFMIVPKGHLQGPVVVDVRTYYRRRRRMSR